MVTIKELLMMSKEKNASDLHITVGIPPMIRINGVLVYTDYDKLMPEDTKKMIEAILSEQQKEELATKGEIDFSFSYQNIGRYRVNVFRQRGSYAAAIRLVATEIPSPRELNIPRSIVDLYQKKRGLVLVTGPTGSGKSTTLASIINEINHKRKSHVITLEDPIEYLHNHKKSMINQREIGLDTNSYANALRASLRQDPDVILVGEMRDLETISIAITAAETGHLVLSTLHTIGAPNTIDRIIDVFPPHQQQQIRIQLSNVLESIVSQQLIPTVNDDSRIAAFEVLHVNAAIRNLIREGKTHQIESIIQTNKVMGMQTMDDAILDLYRNGLISKEKALSFAQNPISIDKRLI
ncbi:twitching motility protein PilT [Natranaerovirga hydrolytica]|uniref:Twitching motility protein PilT n=1 Tax=Natranaerovirga hydrolytica TaxID=680378 RepID=A0A4R1N0F2_9FIRM|nr:type IV pilus twitching motility protein PilT [Natranaerovirga hydrolytica]TCK98380.1 twitching motility protein PilT [Natranaerovirga hydrolytica]